MNIVLAAILLLTIRSCIALRRASHTLTAVLRPVTPADALDAEWRAADGEWQQR